MKKIIVLLIALYSISFSQTFKEVGRFGESGNGNSQFNKPKAISISSDKIVYVVDTGNNRIQLFDLNGKFKKSIGGFGFKSDQFDEPRDIWTNSLINIYVSDYNNQRIQRYDRNMNFINSFENNKAEEIEFQFYEVISCVFSSQNDFFVLDHDENKIVKFKRDGTAERSFGLFNSGKGELFLPEQMELWKNDKLLVSDSEATKIVVYDLFGNFIQKIELENFQSPTGLEVDRFNNIFIADPMAGKIFRISKDLKNVSEISSDIGLDKPQDIASVFIDDKQILFIIDGDVVKILSLD